MKLSKGQKVRVTGNEIFECMGFEVVTGRVFVVNPNGESVSIQCDQTGSLELVDLSDGQIELM